MSFHQRALRSQHWEKKVWHFRGKIYALYMFQPPPQSSRIPTNTWCTFCVRINTQIDKCDPCRTTRSTLSPVSAARAHQLTSHLLFKKQTTSTSPWKAQSKQAAKAGLSTLPLLIKARCLLKNYSSLFLTAPLSPIAHSPLLFPPPPPPPPHSLSCLRLCRRLVPQQSWFGTLVGSLSVFLLSLASFSLPFVLFCLQNQHLVRAGVDPCWPSAAFTIIQGEKLDPHGTCRQRSASRRITSSWSGLAIWCDGNFETHAAACLSK